MEVPIVEGKLNEAYELMTTHDMGCKYMSSQPGFRSMDVGVGTWKNSVILMQKWDKKEDGVACEEKRKKENDYKVYNEILRPLLKAEPSFVAMDIPKIWEGEIKLDAAKLPFVFIGGFDIRPGKWDDLYKLSNTNELGNEFTAAQPGFLSMDIGVDAEQTISMFDLKFDTSDNAWNYFGKRIQGASNTFAAFNKKRDAMAEGPMFYYILDRVKSYFRADS